MTRPNARVARGACCALLLWLLAGTGCSGSAPAQLDQPAPPQPREQAIESAHEALLDSLGAGPNADCPRACELLDSLCELGDRLCALAEDEPDPEIMAQCRDAESRCRGGTVEVERQCGVCPEPGE